MGSQATIPAWRETLDLLTGLWPEWEWTEAERTLWKAECIGFDQRRLRIAIQKSRIARPGNRPFIGSVLGIYRGETAGKIKRKPTDCPRCGDVVPLGDNSLCESCCVQDLGEMRAELRAIEPDERKPSLEKAADALMVWRGAIGPVGQRVIRGRGEQAREQAIKLAKLDPAQWQEKVIGLAWAGAKT